jgi:hypothetical protein
MAPPKRARFAPFPVLLSRRQEENLYLKMLICFQKRFGGIDRLTAIRVGIQQASKQSLPQQAGSFAKIAYQAISLRSDPLGGFGGKNHNRIEPQRGEIFVEKGSLYE